MTFLKKLGQVVLKLIGLWTGFAPLIGQATGASPTAVKVEDKLSQAFNVIITAEQMYASAEGKTGGQKLQAASPFVAQLIQQVDLLSGKHPKNEALFQDAVTRLTAALADVLNSFE
jgi:hypothetical protein